ncbi:MAG TPA: YidB family protein [Candidatus Limnocylindrales bacterium]|nr:YidB family protein [Candidatus Limnocylindrales bacterium]
MGIFDKVENAIGGQTGVNEEQHNTLLQTAMQMFANRGGIGTLLSNAQSSGLSSIVQSWIGRGENQPINAEQTTQLVGQDRLQQLASRVGVPPAIASMVLSRVLPSVVDHATPEGKVPEHDQSAA